MSDQPSIDFGRIRWHLEDGLFKGLDRSGFKPIEGATITPTVLPSRVMKRLESFARTPRFRDRIAARTRNYERHSGSRFVRRKVDSPDRFGGPRRFGMGVPRRVSRVWYALEIRRARQLVRKHGMGTI